MLKCLDCGQRKSKCPHHPGALVKNQTWPLADTNTTAVKLYEKLGFAEFQRVEMKYKKQSGVNYLVYMRYPKNAGGQTGE